MFKKVIKKIFSIFGLQLNRVPAKQENVDERFSSEHVDAFEWFKEYKIETIIDIGANEGQFAEKILTVFPNAIIHCFEPLPLVYGQLAANFKERKNVFVYNFGLGEANEEKQIHNNEYSPSSSMLEMLDLHKTNFDFAVRTEPTQISIRRLDDTLDIQPKRPLLLKIDVQGYELNVLRGGEKVTMLADIIIIETTFIPLYKGQPLFHDIYSYLTNLGFQYAGNIEQLVSPKNNRVLQADAVFFKTI